MQNSFSLEPNKIRLFSDIKISESVLIAIVPLFGYIAAFAYKVGQFSILKVPIEYIQLSIESVFLSSFLTFSTALIIVIFLLVLNKIPKTSDNKETKYFLNGTAITKTSFHEAITVTFLSPIVVGALLAVFTSLSILYITGFSFGLFVLFAGVYFLPPLSKYPNKENYHDKFERYQKEEYKRKIELSKIQMSKGSSSVTLFNLFGLLNINEEHPSFSYIKLTIYLLIWASFALILGALTMDAGIYTTTKVEDKDYVVLGSYSDKFILAGIDKEKKITTNEIFLINNEKDIRMTMENVGRINEQKKY